MNTETNAIIHKLNLVSSELDSLYHQSSQKLGISDSVSMVLYSIYEEGNKCLLSDIYKKSGVSKQTINSAIRTLERKECIYLENYNGRSKRVCLTEEGSALIKKTTEKLVNAENTALKSWKIEELNTFLSLMEKYVGSIKSEFDKL